MNLEHVSKRKNSLWLLTYTSLRQDTQNDSWMVYVQTFTILKIGGYGGTEVSRHRRLSLQSKTSKADQGGETIPNPK